MSVAIRASTEDHLLPRTYEERGVAIPFTTPLLAYARLRKDYRDRLELALGRFSDAEGYYIVLLDAVNELTTLTAHDLMLQEEIIGRQASDPFAARIASLAAAATGIAGTEVAEAASKAVAEEASDASVNRAVLTLCALNEIDGGADRGVPDDVTTAEGQNCVRAALLSADRLPLAADIVMARLDTLAAATAAVGIASSPVEGRLRRLLKRLAEFRASLLEWAQERASVAADDARFCAQMAEVAIRNATALLAELDGKLASPVALVSGGEKSAAAVERLVRRLAYVLDGWDPMITVWLKDQPKPEGEAVAALKEVHSALPLPPREAFPENARQKLAGLLEHTRGWVRLNVDWLTGEPDRDIIERLETRKKEP